MRWKAGAGAPADFAGVLEMRGHARTAPREPPREGAKLEGCGGSVTFSKIRVLRPGTTLRSFFSALIFYFNYSNLFNLWHRGTP